MSCCYSALWVLYEEKTGNNTDLAFLSRNFLSRVMSFYLLHTSGLWDGNEHSGHAQLNICSLTLPLPFLNGLVTLLFYIILKVVRREGACACIFVCICVRVWVRVIPRKASIICPAKSSHSSRALPPSALVQCLLDVQKMAPWSLLSSRLGFMHDFVTFHWHTFPHASCLPVMKRLQGRSCFTGAVFRSSASIQSWEDRRSCV